MAVRWLLSHPWSTPEAAPAEALGCSTSFGRGSHRLSETPGAQEGFQSRRKQMRKAKIQGKKPSPSPSGAKSIAGAGNDCSHSHNQGSPMIHPACNSHSFSLIPFTALQPSLCLPPWEWPGYGSNCSVSLQHLIFPRF